MINTQGTSFADQLTWEINPKCIDEPNLLHSWFHSLSEPRVNIDYMHAVTPNERKKGHLFTYIT